MPDNPHNVFINPPNIKNPPPPIFQKTFPKPPPPLRENPLPQAPCHLPPATQNPSFHSKGTGNSPSTRKKHNHQTPRPLPSPSSYPKPPSPFKRDTKLSQPPGKNTSTRNPLTTKIHPTSCHRPSALASSSAFWFFLSYFLFEN